MPGAQSVGHQSLPSLLPFLTAGVTTSAEQCAVGDCQGLALSFCPCFAIILLGRLGTMVQTSSRDLLFSGFRGDCTHWVVHALPL